MERLPCWTTPFVISFQWKENECWFCSCLYAVPLKWVWLRFLSLVGNVQVFEGNCIFAELSLWTASLVRWGWESPGVFAGEQRGTSGLRWCWTSLLHSGRAGLEPESSENWLKIRFAKMLKNGSHGSLEKVNHFVKEVGTPGQDLSTF